MTEGKMIVSGIRAKIDAAYHALGHADAYLGADRLVAASIEVDKASASIKLAHDALDELLDDHQTT